MTTIPESSSGRYTSPRWAQIPSCPGYWASSDGKVMGRRGHVLSQQYYAGIQRTQVGTIFGPRFVNRLVCEAFHGPPPSDNHWAVHLDCDSSNNSARNLAWQLPKERNSYPVTLARKSASSTEAWSVADPEMRRKWVEHLRIAAVSPEVVSRSAASHRALWDRRHRVFRPEAMARFRAEAAMTRAELGELIGRSYHAIYTWETARKVPRPRNFYALAEALGIDPADLLWAES